MGKILKIIKGAKFNENDTFPIYAPISHHAIELTPVAGEAIVKFTELELPNVLHARELFQGRVRQSFFFSFKGVLIDFNYVLDRFWGDIRTQDTWLPLKWSSENFLTVSEKILKILLLHGNIVDGVGTFLDPISQRGMVTHHGWCFLNVN